MKFEPIRYIYRKTGEIRIEQVPGEGFLKFLYYNPLGKLPLEMLVKRKFLTWFYGREMDKKHSTSRIIPLINSADINMSESEKKVKEFNSFNEFFIRKLKKGARPIEENPSFLASPADGKILAYESLSSLKNFFIKGEKFNLKDFLKNDSLAEKYKDGIFVIVRLAPIDYHRFHFPSCGTISNSKLIDGYYYSVSPHAIKNNFRIFCENKREYSILNTENFGDILLCEVAATMVGGITQSYTPNTFVKKGDEKGYFYFGGSTVVMLFEKNKIKIDKDIIENTLQGLETKVYMGEKIGEKC